MLYLTEQDVLRLLDMPSAIAAVERSFSSRLACSRETFWLRIVSAASRSFFVDFSVWPR